MKSFSVFNALVSVSVYCKDTVPFVSSKKITIVYLLQNNNNSLIRGIETIYDAKQV